MDTINTRAAEQYQSWKETATPEQRAKGLETLNKYKNDPDFRAQTMADLAQIWTESDANQDGKLDLAEYRVW